MRDGLFLFLFPVQSLPYFIAGAAVLAIVASQLSGRLARLGPSSRTAGGGSATCSETRATIAKATTCWHAGSIRMFLRGRPPCSL